MKYRISSATLVAAASCIGCTSGGLGVASSASVGRYLQFKHPVAGVVALQMTFQTPPGCAGMLATLRYNPSLKEMLPYFACVDTSVSTALPSHAVVRNKIYSFLVDIEVINLSECKTLVDSMMNSEGKENLEVVAPCKNR